MWQIRTRIVFEKMSENSSSSTSMSLNVLLIIVILICIGIILSYYVQDDPKNTVVKEETINVQVKGQPRINAPSARPTSLPPMPTTDGTNGTRTGTNRYHSTNTRPTASVQPVKPKEDKTMTTTISTTKNKQSIEPVSNYISILDIPLLPNLSNSKNSNEYYKDINIYERFVRRTQELTLHSVFETNHTQTPLNEFYLWEFMNESSYKKLQTFSSDNPVSRAWLTIGLNKIRKCDETPDAIITIAENILLTYAKWNELDDLTLTKQQLNFNALSLEIVLRFYQMYSLFVVHGLCCNIFEQRKIVVKRSIISSTLSMVWHVVSCNLLDFTNYTETFVNAAALLNRNQEMMLKLINRDIIENKAITQNNPSNTRLLGSRLMTKALPTNATKAFLGDRTIIKGEMYTLVLTTKFMIDLALGKTLNTNALNTSMEENIRTKHSMILHTWMTTWLNKYDNKTLTMVTIRINAMINPIPHVQQFSSEIIYPSFTVGRAACYEMSPDINFDNNAMSFEVLLQKMNKNKNQLFTTTKHVHICDNFNLNVVGKGIYTGTITHQSFPVSLSNQSVNVEVLSFLKYEQYYRLYSPKMCVRLQCRTKSKTDEDHTSVSVYHIHQLRNINFSNLNTVTVNLLNASRTTKRNELNADTSTTKDTKETVIYSYDARNEIVGTDFNAPETVNGISSNFKTNEVNSKGNKENEYLRNKYYRTYPLTLRRSAEMYTLRDNHRYPIKLSPMDEVYSIRSNETSDEIILKIRFDQAPDAKIVVRVDETGEIMLLVKQSTKRMTFDNTLYITWGINDTLETMMCNAFSEVNIDLERKPLALSILPWDITSYVNSKKISCSLTGAQ